MDWHVEMALSLHTQNVREPGRFSPAIPEILNASPVLDENFQDHNLLSSLDWARWTSSQLLLLLNI
jgi:hypothetical protein